MRPTLRPLVQAIRGISTPAPSLRIPERGPATVMNDEADRNERRESDVSLVDRITDLIAERPGIRTAEIADELDIDKDIVRPLIQQRIANSRIIVDKVSGPTGLINAYRINPKWTPADANFAPKSSGPLDDEEPDRLPVRQLVVSDPAQWKSNRSKSGKKAPGGKAKRTLCKNDEPSTGVLCESEPLSTAAPFAPTTGAQDNALTEGRKSHSVEFRCAVFHDGRGAIRTGSGEIQLTPEEVAIVALHFARFSTGAAA